MIFRTIQDAYTAVSGEIPTLDAALMTYGVTVPTRVNLEGGDLVLYVGECRHWLGRDGDSDAKAVAQRFLLAYDWAVGLASLRSGTIQ